MLPQNNWIEHFSNHPSNEDINRNMAAFSNIQNAGVSNAEKLHSMAKEIDTVILAADANNKIMIIRSPTNLGGTRSRPDNKILCMLAQHASNLCPCQFKDSSQKLPPCGPNSYRAFQLQKR
jgi:hypothetical protein